MNIPYLIIKTVKPISKTILMLIEEMWLWY
jgi:hypothetical protein